MTIYLHLYVLSVLFGLLCNIKIYQSFTEAEGDEKIRLFSLLIVRLFLGPLSVYFNIRNGFVWAYNKAYKYYLIKTLQRKVRKSLTVAFKEAGIKVVD
jgi:hypothetical protein